MRSVVVLPAPFGPRKPKISPVPTSRSTPRTASTTLLRALKVRARSWVAIIVPLVGRAKAMVHLLVVAYAALVGSCTVQHLGAISAPCRYLPSEELLSTMNRENIDSVLRSLRRVNFERSFFGQTVAVRFGLSESDVDALELLIDTGSATAGR